MIKKILSVLILLFISNIAIADINEIQEKQVIIPKGSFFKVINLKKLSTEFLDEGNEVSFVNIVDIYADNYIAIPEKSVFGGVIEKIFEPIQGTNGGMKIKINKITTPDNREIRIDAYVTTHKTSSDKIGADLTPPKYYIKNPHYNKGWKSGVMQYVPLNIFEFGQHKVLEPGDEMMVVLKEDLTLFFEQE